MDRFLRYLWTEPQRMRRSVITTLFFLITSATAFAQERSWFVGLKGGVTLPDINRTNEDLVNNNQSIEPVLRYTGGLVFQYFVEKNFGLQVEFNYTQRGWQQRFPLGTGMRGFDPSKNYKVSLDYLEVPVLAHAYLGRKNLRLFLNAGVYVAYLYRNEVERANVDIEADEVFVYDARFQNNVDFGVRGGGGFEIVTTIGMFQAEGSFSWGINSIVDKNLAEIPNIVQNLTPAITFGYFVEF